MEKKAGTRRCRNCPDFESETKSNRYPGYIGVCGRYGKLVKDTLCGCRTAPNGDVTLLNFGEEV